MFRQVPPNRVPGTVPSALHTVTHFILAAALWGGAGAEETEAEGLINRSMSDRKRWKVSWDLGRLAPEYTSPPPLCWLSQTRWRQERDQTWWEMKARSVTLASLGQMVTWAWVWAAAWATESQQAGGLASLPSFRPPSPLASGSSLSWWRACSWDGDWSLQLGAVRSKSPWQGGDRKVTAARVPCRQAVLIGTVACSPGHPLLDYPGWVLTRLYFCLPSQ